MLDLLMVLLLFSSFNFCLIWNHLVILLLVLLCLHIFSLMSDLPSLSTLPLSLYLNWISIFYSFFPIFPPSIYFHKLIFHFVWSKLDRVVYCYLVSVWRHVISHFNVQFLDGCVLRFNCAVFYDVFFFLVCFAKKKYNFPLSIRQFL